MSVSHKGTTALSSSIVYIAKEQLTSSQMIYSSSPNLTITQDKSESYRIFKMRFLSEDTVLQLQY